MYIKCFSPTLLLLFDRKSTLRVRPATVTSGELSSQNLIRGSFHEKVLWTCTQWRLHITTDENSTLVKRKHDLLLLLSDLQEVAAPVTVGVLGGQGERRAGEVQLALGFLCFLRDSIPLVMTGEDKYDVIWMEYEDEVWSMGRIYMGNITLNLTTHLTFLP